jgi:hypothetical protein
MTDQENTNPSGRVEFTAEEQRFEEDAEEGNPRAQTGVSVPRSLRYEP